MFSSPAIRPFVQQENTNLKMTKKLGSSVTRKPFADRSVNRKSVGETNKPLKPRLKLGSDSDFNVFQKATLSSEKPNAAWSQIKSDLSFYDDYCSYKEPKDYYEATLPQFERISIEAIDSSVNSYYGIGTCATPPPVELAEDVDSMFCELPDSDFGFECMKPLQEVPFMENCYEVPLPKIDFDEF